MKFPWQKTLGLFFCLGLAVLFFAFVYGFEILNPHFYSWMLKGDPSQHFFGFNFFKNEPWNWTSPGKIFSYGIPEGTSVVFTDDVPMVSLVLKAILRVFHFSGQLQFFGIWIFICDLLQAGMGYALVLLVSESVLMSMMGSVFFLTFPPFLFRSFQLNRHYTLLAQFLILGAIYLFRRNHLKRPVRPLVWLVLILLALGTHFYLFIYTLLIWVAAEWTRFSEIRFRKRHFLAAIVLLIFGWIYGYAVIDPENSFANAFGEFSMNVFSWFNSEGYALTFPRLPTTTPFEWEGFQYLGLGLILLLTTFIPRLKSKWKELNSDSGSLFIFIMMVFIMLALSIKISVLSVFIPDWIVGPFYVLLFFWFYRVQAKWSLKSSALLALLSLVIYLAAGRVLRASGRTAWVLSYFMMTYLFSLRPKLRTVFICLLIQLVDVFPMMRAVRAENQELLHQSVQNLADQTEWMKFFTHAKQIFIIQVKVVDQVQLSYFALTHQLEIGPVYLARYSKKREREREQKLREALLRGELEDEKVIVVGDADFWQKIKQTSYFDLKEIAGYRLLKNKTHR